MSKTIKAPAAKIAALLKPEVINLNLQARGVRGQGECLVELLGGEMVFDVSEVAQGHQIGISRTALNVLRGRQQGFGQQWQQTQLERGGWGWGTRRLLLRGLLLIGGQRRGGTIIGNTA